MVAIVNEILSVSITSHAIRSLLAVANSIISFSL